MAKEPENINLGWLKDYSGKKFAPKTISTEIYNLNGTSYADSVNKKINEKPGFCVTGKKFAINKESTRAAQEGAEVFNDLRGITSKIFGEVFDVDNYRTIGNVAIGQYSHAEGSCTNAQGNFSHAEGYSTVANGISCHAEGHQTYIKCSGEGGSHAEGVLTKINADAAHAEGRETQIASSGKYGHAEGLGTIVAGEAAHAEGCLGTAIGKYSHVEGYLGQSKGEASHTEGNQYLAIPAQFTVTQAGKSSGILTFAAPQNQITSKTISRLNNTKYYTITLSFMQPDGLENINRQISLYDNGSYYELNFINENCPYAVTDYPCTIKIQTGSLGNSSHTEGSFTIAYGDSSHAEGSCTNAEGKFSHAEGFNTTALKNYSHSEGLNTIASGDSSHAEGSLTISKGNSSHAEGNFTAAYGNSSHAEGQYIILENIEIKKIINTQTLEIKVIDNNLIKNAYNNNNCYFYDRDLKFLTKIYNYKYKTINSGADYIITIQLSDDYYLDLPEELLFEKNISLISLTLANKESSHAEGTGVLANGLCSHAEGYQTIVKSDYSHAEGYKTLAEGDCSHAEGQYSEAIGDYSHAEGAELIIPATFKRPCENTTNAHYIILGQPYGFSTNINYQANDLTNGYLVYTNKLTGKEVKLKIIRDGYNWENPNDNYEKYIVTISEFDEMLTPETQPEDLSCSIHIPCRTLGKYSHVGGLGSSANGDSSFVHGLYCKADRDFSQAFGSNSKALGEYSYVLGNHNVVDNKYGYARGNKNRVRGDCSEAIGDQCIVLYGDYSEAIGSDVWVAGDASSIRSKYVDYSAYITYDYEQSEKYAQYEYNSWYLLEGITDDLKSILNTHDFVQYIVNNTIYNYNISETSSYQYGWTNYFLPAEEDGKYYLTYVNDIFGQIEKTPITIRILSALNGDCSLAIGRANNTSSFDSIIGGYGNSSLLTNSSIVFGEFNDVYGSNLIINGEHNTVKGSNNSIIIGQNNIIESSYHNSLILGENNKIASKNSLILGKFNDPSGEHYLAIGHGQDDMNRKTIFSVNKSGHVNAERVYGAVWNDYAEYRNQKEFIEPGYCVASQNNGQIYKTTEKFQACDGIVSDTFGFAIGETDKCKTPLAVAGRVLAYYNGNKEDYHAGDTVCAGPNGKICKMTREEIREWPDRIIGIVSEIPEYDVWGSGNIQVNNRIWIKIK